MGTFRVYAKEHDATSINRTQTKNSTRKPSDNRMQNNEQSNVTTNKQTAQTSSKHDKYISNINANEDTSNKPLEFDINSYLTHEQKIKLNNLFNKYRDVFSKHSHDLGEFTGGEFKIELKPDAKPVKNLPHRASPKQRQMIDEEVEKLLKAGIIEPCLADYSSPVLLVPKGIDERGRPKEHRLVIDYRQVNNQIKAAHLGPPQLHDFLDTLGGTQGRRFKYFTTLDCVQGYLQIRMHEGSRDYTSFVTHSGQYRYLRAPFGLKTSGSQFIALVNDLFREKLYKDVLVYLDDIVCFSEEFEDHLKTLEWVLNKLLKSKLKLKAPKCKFAYNKVKYLGHIVSEAGVSPDPNKLHAILDYAPPKNAKQVKQILGSFNFYRKFIPNFSKYSKCLTDLTRKNVPFIWADECQRNFQILKEKLMTASVTAFPRFTTENGELPKFNVYTDVSKEALAAILTQVQDNNERLISCIGRNMLPAEMRYSTHEKEALAIFYAFKKFVSYLRYAHTAVHTDCSSLSSILKRPGNAVSPRIARYVYALTVYEYVNTASDEATSAHQYAPSPADDNCPYGSKLTTEMVATEQKLDRKLAPLIKYIDEGTLPEDDKLARKIILQSANYNYTDGLLYHQQASRARNVNQLNIQLVIPDNLRVIVLKEYHDNLGHRGKIKHFIILKQIIIGKICLKTFMTTYNRV